MKKALLNIGLIFITSTVFSQNPTLDWAVGMGGAVTDIATSITTDAFGNVYSTGFLEGISDFDPGPGTVNLISAGSRDIFIQKLDSNSNLLWVKQMGGTDSDQGQAITIDVSGNVYTIGSFMGTTDFDPGSGIMNLTSAGSDVFIQKLDANGNLLWVKQMGGTSTAGSGGNSIDTDLAGNVYTTGTFTGVVDFDPGSGTMNLSSAGSSDIFIQKLDSNGNLLWAKQIGGTSLDQGRAIATDLAGNVYITGSFKGTVDFDPGPATMNLSSIGGSDIFIQKLDANGNLLWVKQMGGISTDNGVSIITDLVGNVFTAGIFRETVDFDPGSGTMNLSSVGGLDIFIQKLDSNGNFLWVNQIGGNQEDQVSSIISDKKGNVYTTGFFRDTIDFDPGSGIMNLSSVGGFDIFVQKLDPNGNLLWVNQMGGTSNDLGTCITMDASENLYTTGYFEDTVDFDPGLGTMNLISKGGSDIFIQKLNSTLPVSTKDISTFNQVIVYPNPTSGMVNINLGGLNDVDIKITDILGKVIYQKSHINTTINTVDLKQAKGLYFITLLSDKEKASFKLVVE